MRVKRGTLPSEREGGRLYVYLTSEPTDRTDELIDELKDRVRSLEEQLGSEREANRENRRIIAALTSRIPKLEAPTEPPDASVSAMEQPGRVEPQTPIEGAQEPLNRRYRWWQFWR